MLWVVKLQFTKVSIECWVGFEFVRRVVKMRRIDRTDIEVIVLL